MAAPCNAFALPIISVRGQRYQSAASSAAHNRGISSVVGIPAYLNGYAALPLVGGLMEQGMAPGAALAFLVAGGITSIPAAMAVFAVARAPVCAAYIGLALAGSLAAGFVYGLIA